MMDFRIYENEFKATHRFANEFEFEYDEKLDVLRCGDRYEPIENIKYVYLKIGIVRVVYIDNTYFSSYVRKQKKRKHPSNRCFY